MECYICDIPLDIIDEMPVACLDCGKTYCETCYYIKSPGCSNVIFGEEPLCVCECGSRCRASDLSPCFVCEREVCIKCREEAEFEDYCYDCIEFCRACQKETKYYFGKRYTCNNCRGVYCEACLNEEGYCQDCLIER